MKRAHTLADERARARMRRLLHVYKFPWTDRDGAILSSRNKRYIGFQCDTKKVTLPSKQAISEQCK